MHTQVSTELIPEDEIPVMQSESFQNLFNRIYPASPITLYFKTDDGETYKLLETVKTSMHEEATGRIYIGCHTSGIGMLYMPEDIQNSIQLKIDDAVYKVLAITKGHN